jgi:threonine/homoserine/homoserine lactone efflux protein
MFTLELFLKGLAFGFLLSAIVGPMWILCLRRTVSYGPLIGLASGMGVAVADGLYGAIAAFGLTAISGFFVQHGFWIGLGGGTFLAYLGVAALLSHPSFEAPVAAAAWKASVSGAFLSTLGLTLANPPTILAFMAIFAGLGLASSGNYLAATLMVVGVVAGSAAWWTILVVAAGTLRRRIGPAVARALNMVSGFTIVGFALWQFARLIRLEP